MARDRRTANAKFLSEAEEVATSVQALRRLLFRSFDADIAESGLTVPQMNALEELSKDDGLSLKELSGRMGLSHSTVSGIVDRLERRGFVGRTPDPKDRRYSRILLSEEVKDYVREEVPSRRLGPILKALELASAEEREQILAGIGTLRRLLESVVSDGGENPVTGEATTGQGAP
jgi:MarR family transcriptional regulator, organic hydroperoxide resistance regulator